MPFPPLSSVVVSPLKRRRSTLRWSAVVTASVRTALVGCTLALVGAASAYEGEGDPRTSATPAAVRTLPLTSNFDAATAGDPVVLQDHFRSLSDRAARSVVAITAVPVAPVQDELWSPALTGDRLMRLTEQSTRSVGTGFAIAPGGLIVTSEHVVSDASAVWITTDDGRAYPAIVVGSDPRGDVAVLRAPVDLPPLVVAGAGSVRRGDWCLTLGNPAGLAGQGGLDAAVGTVGNVGRSLPGLSQRENRSYAGLLQLSTPIAPGSSGGPVLNLRGDAIGLVCAVVPPGTHGQSVAFAMPLDADLLARLDRLARGEEVVYPYLGVNVSAGPAGDASPSALRLAGVRVDEIDARAPAEGVLRRGDILVKVNGQAVDSDDGFARLVAASRVDAEIVLTLRREGQEVDVTIRPRKRELVAAPVTAAARRLAWGGATFRTRFDEKGVPNGVVVDSVVKGARFDRVGLKRGDAFATLFDRPVKDVVELQAVLWEHAKGR